MSLLSFLTGSQLSPTDDDGVFFLVGFADTTEAILFRRHTIAPLPSTSIQAKFSILNENRLNFWGHGREWIPQQEQEEPASGPFVVFSQRHEQGFGLVLDEGSAVMIDTALNLVCYFY